MALPFPILDEEIAAKAPMDEELWAKVKANEEDLDGRTTQTGNFDYQFKVNGNLGALTGEFGVFPAAPISRMDGALISKSSTLQQARLVVEDMGNGGVAEVDVRITQAMDAAIQKVTPLFKSAISSIGTVSTLSVQSLSRATAQIATQSIAKWKAIPNITSIVYIGLNTFGVKLFRYNLDSALDSDWKAGDTVIISGATNSANNGTLLLDSVRHDGGNNVVLANASGVEQSGSAGSVELCAWKLTFVNPVSSQFAAGELVALSGHTTPANNGSFPIYAINQGGNNIIVKSSAMVAQAAPAGAADVLRFSANLASPAPTTDFRVGDDVRTSGFTSGGNNATFGIRVTGVNVSGNNVIFYNSSGSPQAGVGGVLQANIWVYTFGTDPSADISATHRIVASGTTSGLNEGAFEVRAVNRGAGFNVAVYNTAGVAQGASAGTLYSSRRKLEFSANQAQITNESRIHVQGSPHLPKGDYDVVEANRGGGANYNAVVSYDLASEQVGAAGRVGIESKSIFTTRPSVESNFYFDNFKASHMLVSANAALHPTRKILTSGMLLTMDITRLPGGAVRNLTLQLL